MSGAGSYQVRSLFRKALVVLAALMVSGIGGVDGVSAQTASLPQGNVQRVVIDTDFGDDIDDAFALALALKTPQFKIEQVNSAFGQTGVRSQMLERFLRAAGRSEIPIATGPATATRGGGFTQRRYGERDREDVSKLPDAVTSTLSIVRAHPGEVTLIALAPLSNIEAMIDREPNTFRLLKRVVLMGGSVYRGYGDLEYAPPHGPDAEWNIQQDVAGARKLFASGVPIFMLPLDATQMQLDEVKRGLLFRVDSPLADQLTILYHLWNGQTPTLFDPVAVAFAADPSLCSTTPLRIQVDDGGFTRVQNGAPNAQVCLQASPDRFFAAFMPRLLEP